VTQPIDITFDSHYDRDTLVIENKTFRAMEPGQTAITLRWPASPSIAQCSVILRNLCFKPGLFAWQNCIHLVNAWNGVIENVNGYSGPDGSFHNGIILDGQCMDVKIRAAHFVHPITGVYVTGESEGPTIHDTRVLGGIYGVYASTPQGEAGMTVSDSHFAVSVAGIVAVNRPQAIYHDLLIYRHPWRAGESFTGIYVGPGSDDTDIHDVKVKGFGFPTNPVAVWQANNVRQHNVQALSGS
jgi:hypothetical protein